MRRTDPNGPADTRLMGIIHNALRRDLSRTRTVLTATPPPAREQRQAIAGHVPPGHTTVGMRVQLDHLAPTPVGAAVTAEARLDKIEGRRLTFSVSASDDRGLIAAGKVTRVVVDVDKFMDKCT